MKMVEIMCYTACALRELQSTILMFSGHNAAPRLLPLFHLAESGWSIIRHLYL